MQKPALVVMAAGLGSRFGGLKQLTAVDDTGSPILDYSLYDARRAGFETVVFIIQQAMKEDFHARVGRRAAQRLDVRYVYQRVDNLPEGFSVPEGRTRPWGTAHAVACCRGTVNGPFAVINADDFYGAGAFRTIYDFLSGRHPGSAHAMVGYQLRNTVTEYGSVARGICEVRNGFLQSVTERTQIQYQNGGLVYLEEEKPYPLTGDETVSMNFWGFSLGMLERLWDAFPAFLTEAISTDPLRREYFLPTVVSQALADGESVQVLDCDEVWHGVTYREDLPVVRQAIAALRVAGEYPERLFMEG